MRPSIEVQNTDKIMIHHQSKDHVNKNLITHPS